MRVPSTDVRGRVVVVERVRPSATCGLEDAVVGTAVLDGTTSVVDGAASVVDGAACVVGGAATPDGFSDGAWMATPTTPAASTATINTVSKKGRRRTSTRSL